MSIKIAQHDMSKQAAVFLDRDGTLINERGYLSDFKKIVFYKNAFKALTLLSKANFLLFIITNQSGIGRGLVTRAQLKKIHRVLLSRLRKKGIKISHIYFCPHTPEKGCRCRKPKPYFAFHAERKFKLDLKSSFMVGDQNRDIGFGLASQMSSVLVLTGYGKATQKKMKGEKLVVKKDLLSAAHWILRQRKLKTH